MGNLNHSKWFNKFKRKVLVLSFDDELSASNASF